MTKIENRPIYAMYKGDEFLCEGTKNEICNYMNIKENTFNFYRTKHYIVNRNSRYNNRRMVFRIDKNDRMHPDVA